MPPLVDMHVHLLAGLDDGPKTEQDALEMCVLATTEGVRFSVALAHQNEHYGDVTPDRIREAAAKLIGQLHQQAIALTVFPTAEIMVTPELDESWRKGELLSVADRKQFLLLEMPHNLFVDLRALVQSLREAGVRPILAHPERCPELLHTDGLIEELIQEGCLVQVSTGSVTDPESREDEKALKGWFRRGVVHLFGSDGHSVRRRPPRLAGAYERIRHWAGDTAAERICSANGLAILNGKPFRVPPPELKRVGWFTRLFGG